MAANPHTAVKQELLVRYLDYWVPTAVPAGRASFLDLSGDGAPAALRVASEFADLLTGRELSVLAAGPLPPDPALPGLRLVPLPADPAAVVGAAGRTPVLGYLDLLTRPASAVPAAAVVAALAAASDGELIRVSEPSAEDPREELSAAGFSYVVAVELVTETGAAQLLCFATSSSRSLERFKEELWAVDEFAGIRYRDPAEPHAGLLDISYQPYPGPLRRALLARLAAVDAPQTVDELREYALTHTLYRAADVPRALSPLLSRGALAREPTRGRLTGATRLRLVS